MSVPGAGWQWPDETERNVQSSEPVYQNDPFAEQIPKFKNEAEEARGGGHTFHAEADPPVQDSRETNEPEDPQAHFPTRQCRICLEEVPPTFEPVPEGITTFLGPRPRVQYISADPESGRLLRPCKCRGSQKYVHEGCLQQWRHADPRYARQNYWECPTCKFKYRLERMRWSRWLQSTLLQIGITLWIMVMTVFVLGFVADPIINLYFEPTATISSIATGHGAGHLEFEDDLDDYDGWIVHFMKGLTSIGVLGFVKVLFTLNPFSWWNLRQVGLTGGGRGRRERSDGNFTFIIIVGVVAFLFGLWTWVRAWSRRTLENVGERVADVQGDDDDDDDHEHAD